MDQPTPTLTLFQRANESASLLIRGLPQELRNPKVAIICGSGLGGLADAINPDPRAETPYHDIPRFPRSTGKFAIITAKVQATLKQKARRETNQFHNQLDSDDAQSKAMTVNSFLALSAPREPQ